MSKNKVCFLGGKGVFFEADKTFLLRRGVIRNPNSPNDETKEIVWILGGVNKNRSGGFFY